MCLSPNTSIPWPQFPNHFARVNNCWCVVTQGHSQWRNVIRACISHHRGSCLPADPVSPIPCADAHLLPTLPLLRPESLGWKVGTGQLCLSRCQYCLSWSLSPLEARGQNILLPGAGNMALPRLTLNFRACECL